MSFSSQVMTQFSGISVTTTYPPHNGLAVGPNYIVMVEGSRIEWTNLTGGSPTLKSVYDFFAPLSPTGGLYDPRVMYDSVNQRFVVIMEYGASGNTVSAIDIAVSKDANPNDGWYFASLNTSLTLNGQLTASDRPMLSVDGGNVYITAPQFGVNVSSYPGTEEWIIGDTAGAGGGIYNGGALTVTANQLTPANQGYFTVVAGNNGKSYYGATYSTGSQIVLTLQVYDAATNTFGPSSNIGLGNIDQGGSYTAQQMGTTLLLDAGDKRLGNLVYANGFLYGVNEIKPIGSSVPAVHWFKVDISNPSAPVLVAQGNITGASIGTNVATFNGSIAVDAAGDILINFTASGPNMFPADYYVFQGGSDPIGSFSAPILYQASTGFFNSGDGASVQRWGLNSSTVVDPNNPNSFWLSNEYVANGWWQTAVAQVAIQNSGTTAPAVSSIVASGAGITNGSGDLNAGQVVTLTVNFSAAVIVNTTGGTPTLALNDSGTATFTGGSGSTALTFSYTVAAGQNTSDLVISAFNLNGATVQDAAGNTANLSGATNNNPAGILQIDTTAPSVSAIVASGTGITSGNGVLGAGSTVTLTANFSEAVTVNTTGGTPTLTLNDGGTATFTGGSGSTALAFSYIVAAGQNTPDLTVTALNLGGATIRDGGSNAANLSGATNFNPAGILQIDTTAASVSAIVASGTGITGGNGVLGTGATVTLTVNFSEAVTVNTTGGTPTLALNDGGTATFTGGSGSTALTFSYTVAAGQNTSDLVVSAFNLNGATVKDAAGNAANLSGATNFNPAGTLQIETTAPTVASIVPTGTGISGGNGVLGTGATVTLTVNFSEAVTVNTTGGTPTLALNDGGTATFAGGSGSTALTFSYTVAAGQNTPDLTVTALNLGGATIKDSAGNAANLAGATNYNPAGILQISTAALTVSSIVASGAGITNGGGDLNAGDVVTLTVNFSAAVTVNTSGGTPTLALNDGGTATYTSGSGSTALTFSYTVAAGQNTSDLVVSAFNLNGATVKDAAGNAADVSGATNFNPAGILQIDTTVPSVASIAPTGTGITNGTGNLGTGQVVTLTANFSEAVTVNTTAGSPTLALNDGGTATYTGGSGTSALTFTYTVAVGQNTPDLSISAFNLNGATIVDGAGNAANLSAATNYNPAGSLKVNTTGVPNYSHIVVVVEENKNYNEIAGSAQAPFINSLMTNGASLTNFTAETHPSEPNYYALYAGSTFGITDDNDHSLPDPTLYTVLRDAGLTFTGYVDDSGTGNETQHEPWVSFPEGRTVQTNFISFPALFANGNYSTLPSVSFVIPNPTNDMHDGTIAQGDTWLQQNLGAYAQWALANNSLLVVTWDENDNEAVNQIPTLLYGANVVSGNYSAAYNHYNVLSTVLAPFGLTGPNNAATAATIQVFGGVALVSSITTSGPGITAGAGNLNAGKTVTITVTFNTPVVVNTAGGSPRLSLNDGGFASYSGGSGTAALTFSYTVAAGQNTPDLTISAFNLNGATLQTSSGGTVDVSGATNLNPAGILQIDTTAATVASIVPTGTGISGGNGVLGTGATVTLTANFSEAVTVNTTGGTPTLALNDGGTATFTGGSGSTALTFSYTVAAGQNTPDLTVTALNLGGATINDGAGNVANLSGATNYNPAGILQIGTTALTVSSIVASGAGITSGSGDLNAGDVVTLTVNFSTAVTVNTTGGTPTLALNDGGTATFTGGSGTTALTFSYTVAAGQNTSDLVVSAFNLNGATVKDAAGNAADLSGSTNNNPAGILQIDTTAPIPVLTQEPPAVTGSTTAAFAFGTSNSETNGVTFAYKLDGAATWTTVIGTTLSLSGLANGAHTIQVQATDGAGNVSATPANYNWTISPAVAQVETQFSGPSVTSTYPPHNALAVGPNNVVMLEGSRIEWTNLAGGAPTLQSVYQFFSPLGATATNSLNHPRAVYDSVNQRYIVLMDNSASGHAISTIDIAVSKDADPSHGWYFTSLNTSITINGQLTSADRPTLSVDGTNIYITASQYNVNVSGYAGTEAWVISDTAGAGGGIYNGGTPTIVATQTMPSTQSIFSAVAGNNGKTYYASTYSNGSQIVVTLQVYDAATNTFGPSSTIGLGNIDLGGSYTAQQQGTTLLLDAGDKRTANLVYANGFLYGVSEIKPIGSSVPAVHWFKIDVSNPNGPALVAQGNILGTSIGTNVATFNGSIAVDPAGDVMINFTASGPNMFPADYYVVQRGSDPAGSFSAPTLYQASTGFFNSGNGASVQPWGGYSTAVADPNSPNSFWISNEYVASGWWQTAVAQVAIEAPEPPTLTIANSFLDVAAGGSVPLGITVQPVDPDDLVWVKIDGLTSYENVTDNSDQLVFSGPTITLSAAEVNSGLTLHSTYAGTDRPVNTLTVTASNTTSGEAATTAPQTITVTDPPPATITNADLLVSYASTTGDSALTKQAVADRNSNWFDLLVAPMDKSGADVFHFASPDTSARILGSNVIGRQEFPLSSSGVPPHRLA